MKYLNFNKKNRACFDSTIVLTEENVTRQSQPKERERAQQAKSVKWQGKKHQARQRTYRTKLKSSHKQAEKLKVKGIAVKPHIESIRFCIFCKSMKWKY